MTAASPPPLDPEGTARLRAMLGSFGGLYAVGSPKIAQASLHAQAGAVADPIWRVEVSATPEPMSAHETLESGWWEWRDEVATWLPHILEDALPAGRAARLGLSVAAATIEPHPSRHGLATWGGAAAPPAARLAWTLRADKDAVLGPCAHGVLLVRLNLADRLLAAAARHGLGGGAALLDGGDDRPTTLIEMERRMLGRAAVELLRDGTMPQQAAWACMPAIALTDPHPLLVDWHAGAVRRTRDALVEAFCPRPPARTR